MGWLCRDTRDLEEQHDREHELTNDNGLGDAGGLHEQRCL
jgi:hypothetical protein